MSKKNQRVIAGISSLIGKIKPVKKYERSILLDALRGFAIIMMVIFHFFYDLTLFGLADIPIYSSPYWIYFRFIILCSFLGSVGASLYLHHQRGMNYSSFCRRIIFIVINAWLITAITYVLLAEKYVFFGILHLIALASVLALLFMRLYWLNLLLGLAIVYIGYNYDNGVFDHFGLRWLGMLPRATGSADFTPIFPFFGLVLIGMFCAKALGDSIYEWRVPATAKYFSLISECLAGLGRHALIIYMLHQPILWGLLYIYQLVI